LFEDREHIQKGKNKVEIERECNTKRKINRQAKQGQQERSRR
jgi:hypothetical protein